MTNNQNKTILIAGGSWGCGEWRHVPGSTGPTAQGGIAHTGLSRYLLDSGFQVVNLSQAGGSNIEGANRVDSFITNNRHMNISCVIVFQTEWIRDLFLQRPSMLADDLTHGYHNLKHRIMSRLYHQLSATAVAKRVPIYLIGGCSDTIWLDKFEQEYPSLHIVCQSLTNLLTKNDHRNPDPVHCIFGPRDEEEIKHIRKHASMEDLELLLEDIEKGSARIQLWAENKQYFWPDGYHANREGHKVLFDYLLTKIPELHI